MSTSKRKLLAAAIKDINNQFIKNHYLPNRIRQTGGLQKLNEFLLHQCDKYKLNINLAQKFIGGKIRKEDKINDRELVACAIAAKVNKSGALGSSHGHFNEADLVKLLTIELKKLGTIGKQPSMVECDNIIGKCAEVKAANILLINNKKASLMELEFTKARRPRTYEIIARCNNCKTVFGNE